MPYGCNLSGFSRCANPIKTHSGWVYNCINSSSIVPYEHNPDLVSFGFIGFNDSGLGSDMCAYPPP